MARKGSSRRWTKEDIDFLQENYGSKNIKVLCNKLVRSTGAIRSKAFELGLKSYVYGKKECSAPGCDRLIGARQQLCSMHRQRKYRKDSAIRQRYRDYAKNHRNTPKGRYSTLKGECKRRNIVLNLSLEDYIAIWCDAGGCCSYCESKITHAGPCLDRADSSLSYSKENCVLCCVFCNRVKGELLTATETKFVIKQLKELRNTTNIWAEYEFALRNK